MALLTTLLLAAAPSVALTAGIDGAAPKPGWVYARRGQTVVLHATTTGGDGSGWRWHKLEPTAAALDNTQPKFHFEPVPYRATELERCRGQARCTVDVAPTVLPEVLPGVGTMAFQVTVTVKGTEVSTPGLESVDSAGLSRKVMRVTFRRDDTYLGYLTELFNTPYIFGSDGPAGRHQSDLLIGSDCADLAIYGRKRLGKPATYTSSYGIDAQAPEVVRVVSLDGERGLDGRGLPVAKAQPGDLLHFPGSRHVAVLYEDREPKGVLGPNDLMLHTCWAPPTIEPIGQSGCVSLPWRVLRFR